MLRHGLSKIGGTWHMWKDINVEFLCPTAVATLVLMQILNLSRVIYKPTEIITPILNQTQRLCASLFVSPLPA